MTGIAVQQMHKIRAVLLDVIGDPRSSEHILAMAREHLADLDRRLAEAGEPQAEGSESDAITIGANQP